MSDLETLPEDDDVLERLSLQHEDVSRRKQQVPSEVIVLPNDHCTFSESAQNIFPKLAATQRYFIRGVAVELVAGTLVRLFEEYRIRMGCEQPGHRRSPVAM